ncbi:helix-turn-helix domain-containing protein [Eubacterium maltosivorans]|uniref:helix-turn-helix domain-containing protein n=1 Tax=Eubacterium maltosivorans TaxID=2041044 RepID=UPI0018A0F66F|nr:helix-turn-helix transcriptional regulator [Eubacterium maltosivorans]
MNNLKMLRQEKNWTQTDLANHLGVQASAISKYENGKLQLSDQLLVQLSTIFDVSVDFILGNSSLRSKTEKNNLNANSKNNVDKSLTEKNKKDIAYKMRRLREDLKNEDGLMLDGEILSEETKELLLHLLEKDEIAATLNNKKYIPKKYRK